MRRYVAEPGYGDFDRERLLPEHREQLVRGEFARDRARVVHSAALRRLGAKTQVLSPSGGDFARTRLTHSLEVAQIGREMAIDLEVNPEIVDMACLAHDLGHPPFGHNGERALNEWAADFGGFEANAQTLRLLTRIEPKVISPDGRSYGLNLTRASLDATCKYPWSLPQAIAASNEPETSEVIATDEQKSRVYKFGYYLEDSEVFDWLRQGAKQQIKCIEAQIMDFADDVAYSVHDFEDAIVAGFVDLTVLADPAAEFELLKKISTWNQASHSIDDFGAALARLRQNQYWLNFFGESQSDLGTLKNLTSSLIGSFVSRTTDAVVDASAVSSLARYGSQLAIPADVRAEIAVLKGLVSAFLMSHESRRPFYEWQRALLTELADELLATNGAHLEPVFRGYWAAAVDDASQHRVVVDQIASLTDQSALSLHNRLIGSRSKD